MNSPQFHSFDIVDSTNDIALRMAREGAPEGVVITAQCQRKGRGRRGHIWWDVPGESVLMSMLLRPKITINEVHQLSFVTSVALAKLLRTDFSLSPALKWPNDVLIDNRKISGILVEVAQTDDGIAAIVGVGLNVRQRNFPDELIQIATSLALEGVDADTQVVTERLAEKILLKYYRYIRSGFEEILREWTKYMWGVGRQAAVEAEGERCEGKIMGVSQSGALLLKQIDGQQIEIVAANSVHTDFN